MMCGENRPEIAKTNPILKMPPNGPDEWRARIGQWENRKLRWYQAHCGSRPRVPLHLHLERVISEVPLLCVLLLLSLVGRVDIGLCEAGNGALSSLGKLVGSCRRRRASTTPLLSLSLALSLLLVVAGDVETNPGPISDKLLAQVDDSELTEDDTFDVCNEVVGVAGRWSHMCLALRLHPSDRSQIAVAHPGNPEECLQAVVIKWLQKGYNYQICGSPSWRMLVGAVGNPAGGNDCTLAEAIAKRHPVNKEAVKMYNGNSSSKIHLDPKETHHLSRDFARMFSDLSDLLNKSVDMAKLKDFLGCYSHPLYPEKPYVDPKFYKDANTTKELIKSLCPQFINFMHYYLLEDIVETFGCDRAKKVLQQYTDQMYSRKRKLNSLPDPIMDGEIEQFQDTKKLKVQVEGDENTATVEIIGELQKALEQATGIKRAVITYALYDPGSILLTFLIPESILHIFHDLNTEDLAILADIGVMKLEVDEVVFGNTQQYSTRNSHAVEIAVGSGEHTKPTGLEYYLKLRATEMTSQTYLRLLKLLSSIGTGMLNDICSEQFLAMFSKDLEDWKQLAPYLSIYEWNIKELVCNYPNENDQKYQALMCWKRAEGSTATYYNLIESLILHGNIGEVEGLLQRLGEGPVVLHASRWLKEQYLAHDSWQQWRQVPNLVQFDQRLGELTTQASKQLTNVDYSKCYYDMQDEFPSSIIPVSVKALANACTSSDHPWSSKLCILIKGKPGQGKSFLLSKLCRYWALGYGMRSITLMFWVDCSRFFNRRMTLNQLLSKLLPIETQNISKWMKNKQGQGVVFVLDGYDQQRSGGVFHNLASRKFLPKSVVLIASPCTLNQINVKQLELLNLTENQISKQVSKFFSFRTSNMEDFCLYLNNNPDMRLLASSPVYLYTLLFVCNNLLEIPSDELPVTWTELFTNMILLLLSSTFSKLLQIETPPASLSQLPSTMQLFLRELSTIAFENLTSESLQLNLSAVRSLGHGSDFALVHLCNKPLWHSEKWFFEFSSPLLQQFLAALHVHSLPQTKQTELLVQTSELNFLWQFFAGLLVSESYDRFSILRNTYHKQKLKMLANCAYEANYSWDMQTVFRDHVLTPADIHHIVTCYKFSPDLNFVQCCFGRAALCQLTRQVHTFAHSGQQGFRVSFEECVFSSEAIWLLAAAPFQKLRFCGLSTEDLCSLAVGLKKCRWVKGPRCLDLTHTGVTGTGAIALAKALQQNKSLKELNLALSEYQWTWIGDEGVTALADSRVIKNFKTLDLSCSGVTDNGVIVLAKALQNNKSLEGLNLTHTGVTSIGAIALAKALQQNKSLKELNLDWEKYQWTCIGDEGVTALADPRVIKNFKTLNLESNDIGESGAAALANALRVNQSLTVLNLWENRIGGSGAAALADALRVNQSLTTLNLWNNGIGESGAAALANALRLNQNLTTLNLALNRIGEFGAAALANALRVNQSLTTLDFAWNGIRESGAAALADALRLNQSLTTLILGKNGIAESGTVALADALRVNKSLTKLDLWKNGIGESGAAALADALKVNQNLTTLNLAWSRIGESGATALADALRLNQSLTTLILTWNDIGESGATSLADALKVNQSLTTLNVWNNHCGATGAAALADALRVNQSLTTLDLEGNDIGESGAAALANALRVNQSLTTLNLGNLGIISENTEQLLRDNERINYCDEFYDYDY